MRINVVLAAALLLESAAALGGQGSKRKPSPVAVAGDAQVSPAVLVTWFGAPTASGGATLQLAVVWRGHAGWQKGGIHGRSSMAYAARSIRSNTGELRTLPARPARVEYSVGSTVISVEYDPWTQAARLLGRTVRLRQANVLLVDGVGDPKGPRLVGEAKAPSAIPAGPVREAAGAARRTDTATLGGRTSRVRAVPLPAQEHAVISLLRQVPAVAAFIGQK